MSERIVIIKKFISFKFAADFFYTGKSVKTQRVLEPLAGVKEID